MPLAEAGSVTCPIILPKNEVNSGRRHFHGRIDLLLPTSGESLERGMALACAMFKDSFSPTITAKALTYFEDGDLPGLSGKEKEILIRAATAMGDLPTVSMQSALLGEPVSLQDAR